MMKATLSVALLLLSSLAAFGQDNSLVLVPINPGVVHGANGAQWTTTLWAFNAFGRQVGLNCTVPATCELIGQFETVSLPAPDGLTHPGYFVQAAVLNPNNGLLQPVTNTPWLELRTVDSATAPHSAGTQIPLPHIDEFSGSEMFFPHIPLNGHSRLKLRLYGVQDVTVFLDVWGLEQHANDPSGTLFTGVLYFQGRYDLTGAIAGQVPSYAEVDLPTLLDVSAVRVAVSPLLPAGRLVWGFVTITDNQSEQVTIATPTAPNMGR